MKEKIVRYIIVGFIFLMSMVFMGAFFKTQHWLRWLFFTVAYIGLLRPALEYWNEKLKG